MKLLAYDMNAWLNHPKYHPEKSETTEAKNMITHNLVGDLENIRMNHDAFSPV